jgi:hypothetical protein
MKQLITSAILLIGCNVTLLAKIGEDELQVEKRYGASTGRWGDVIGYVKHYEWRGFTVAVSFVNGISQRESFNRVWPDAPGRDNRDIERQMKIDKKLLAEISALGKNGVILEGDSGYTYTTKKFEGKYSAARTTAWAKAKHDR